MVEHFWCAPYVNVLSPRARRVILDLHNIESELARTVAQSETWPDLDDVPALRRLVSAARESAWIPEFDAVLTTSEADARRVRAEGVPAIVYPNTVSFRPVPEGPREDAIVFTGNMEYHPNVSAVRWFAREIWPLLHAEAPRLEWRLVGKNPEAIASIVIGLPGARLIGPVDDAIAEIARARVAGHTPACRERNPTQDRGGMVRRYAGRFYNDRRGRAPERPPRTGHPDRGFAERIRQSGSPRLLGR